MTNPQDALRQQLMHALHNDDFSTVDNLLQQGANVNLPYNHHGWTPFMWVCKEHCNPEIITKFLICGGKVDKANKHGKTPLHIMARYRSSALLIAYRFCLPMELIRTLKMKMAIHHYILPYLTFKPIFVWMLYGICSLRQMIPSATTKARPLMTLPKKIITLPIKKS